MPERRTTSSRTTQSFCPRKRTEQRKAAPERVEERAMTRRLMAALGSDSREGLSDVPTSRAIWHGFKPPDNGRQSNGWDMETRDSSGNVEAKDAGSAVEVDDGLLVPVIV